MPQPTLESVAPGGVVNLSNAPASLDEATFDELFPAEPRSQVAAPQAPPSTTPAGTQPAPAAPAVQQPTTPVQAVTSAPFLKGERSIYNSPEAAVVGINEKDALIESLRQRYALTTGIDPVTNKPVGQVSQAPSSYYDNPNQYLKDLYEAAQKSPEAYRDVQLKFFSDAFAPQLSALQPLIQQSAKDAAVTETAKEIPAIKDFISTPTYQRVLDQSPDLKGAIVAAETDHRFHSRLPGLYKIAFLAGQGLQLPEILRAQQTVPPQTQVTPRPTAQPGTLTPPQTPAAKPSFKTHDGIKAAIAELEAKGVSLSSW